MKIRTKSSIRRHIPVIHGGKIPVKNSDHNIIDFSSNITPLGIPNSVKLIIKKNLDKILYFNGREALKDKNQIVFVRIYQNQILLFVYGAIEILYNFCFAFLSKTTKVLIHVPTFQEYETAVKLSNCKISYFKSLNLSHSVIIIAQNHTISLSL